MIRVVRIGDRVLQLANERFGEERSAAGRPSEYDFVGGPLAAALIAFRDFEHLRFDVIPQVRTYTIVDPFFGVVVFVGALLTEDTVEIVDFDDDPEYWSTIRDEAD